MKTEPNKAQAKARILTISLRAAADAAVSAQAQALLAVIIAESWVDGTKWTARLGMELIARRLNCTRHSIQRWAKELERAQLVRRRIGKNGTVSRWTIRSSFDRSAGAPVGSRQRSGSGAPALHNPVRRRSTDSDVRCVSGLDADRSTGSIADEPKADSRTSRSPRNALPNLSTFERAIFTSSENTRRIVRNKAALGCLDALVFLREMGEIVAIDSHCTTNKRPHASP